MADEPRPEVKVDTRQSSTVQVSNVNRQTKPPFGFKIVAADKFESKKPPRLGLVNFVIAAVSAPSFEDAVTEIRAAGGVVTSSGAVRDLTSPVDGNTRAAASFHYTGRAADLYIYSGMIDPETDPYLVVTDGSDGLWEVFGRASDPAVPETTLLANKRILLPAPKPQPGEKPQPARCKLEVVPVTGRFFSVTAIFKKHGFERIPAKAAFTKDPNARLYEAAEWWHFQDEKGLVVGKTTFGELLLQVHTKKQLEGSAPFASKDALWNGKIFQ